MPKQLNPISSVISHIFQRQPDKTRFPLLVMGKDLNRFLFKFGDADPIMITFDFTDDQRPVFTIHCDQVYFPVFARLAASSFSLS